MHYVDSSPADKAQAKNRGRGFSWVVAILLLLCLFVNYIDRQTLSVLVKFLPPELKMSNSTYGQIQSLFLLSYSIAMPFAGWMVDRLGARIGLSITVAIWSVFELLHGTAHTVTQLGTYRLLLGIPEAAGLPAVSKVAAEHAAPYARATLIGIAMFGLGMGSTLAPPIVSFLTDHYSWRWAFYGTGLFGIAWVLLWLAFYHPTSHNTVVDEKSVQKTPWIHLLKEKRVLGLMLARAFSDSVWWFYLFWIPPFLVQSRHLNLHDMGVLGWIPYFFASIGSVVGGYASGMLITRGWEPLRARRTIMWVCALVVPFTSLVVKAQGIYTVLALLGLATFAIQAFFANIFSLPADLFPREKVASVFGLNTMTGGLAGFLTVQAAGFIVDKYSSYTPVFAGVAVLMPLAAIVAQTMVNKKTT